MTNSFSWGCLSAPGMLSSAATALIADLSKLYESSFYAINLNYINRETYNNHELEANNLIERMNGSLITQRPSPTLEGLKRIIYENEIDQEKSLEEYYLLHLISSNV